MPRGKKNKLTYTEPVELNDLSEPIIVEVIPLDKKPVLKQRKLKQVKPITVDVPEGELISSKLDDATVKELRALIRSYNLEKRQNLVVGASKMKKEDLKQTIKSNDDLIVHFN